MHHHLFDYQLNLVALCPLCLQVIGGSAAKKYGGKNILTLAVFMWSLSTFITPFFASSIYALIMLRVMLGIGEGLGKHLHVVMVVQD